LRLLKSLLTFFCDDSDKELENPFYGAAKPIAFLDHIKSYNLFRKNYYETIQDFELSILDFTQAITELTIKVTLLQNEINALKNTDKEQLDV